jgi:amino acid transporter
MIQAVIVSILSLIFILMPTVNSSYWILSVITSQLALLVYIILFAAGLKLHYKKPEVKRSFRVPGKRAGMWIICSMGAVTSLVVIFFGFIPPSIIPFESVITYEAMLIGGVALCCIAPLYFLKKKR